MSDVLVKRPVLRIYTEATSGNGGLWAFAPYKSVHTVFVEESNYRDLEDRIEALTAESARLREVLAPVMEAAAKFSEEPVMADNFALIKAVSNMHVVEGKAGAALTGKETK